MVGLAGLLMTPEELFAPLTLNTRIEALMPRLVFPAELDIACGQPERPTSLQVQASTLILANHLPNGLGPGTQLQELILNYKEGHNHDCNKEFFKSSIMHSFPKKSSDLQIRWNVFQNRDPVQPPEAQLHVHNDPLYYFHCDQLWLEFSGAKTAGNKPQPFLDPIPLTLFTHLTYHTSNIREINLLIDCPSSAVNVHLSHYQFLFIARLSESLQRVADALSEDYNEIFDTGNHNFKDCTSSEAHFFNLMKSSVKTSLQTGIRLKCLSITLVMPALCEPIPKMDSINSIFNDRSWSDIPQHCPPSDFAEEQNFEVCRPPEPDTSDKPLRSKPQFLQNFIQKVDPDPEVIKSNSLSNSHSERQSFPYSSSKSKVKRIDESKRSTSHSNYQQKSFNPASLPFKVGQFGSLDKKVTSFGMSVRGFGEKMLATMQSHDEVASSHTDSVVSPTDSDLSDSEDEAIVLLLQDSLIEHQQLNLPGVSLVSRSSELRNYLANNTQMKSDERDEAFSVTSSGTSRNRDVFSTITFHLTGVDTSIGYADHAASVAFSLNDCRISESGREQSVMSSSQQSGSPYLGTSISVPMENTDSKFLKPLLLCRIETAPPNDQDKADDDSKSNISIETRLLRPLDLSFLMSSLTNMIDFFEEEILPKSGPSGSSSLSVLLDILGGNVTLKLDEDRPCANLTCPGQHSQLKMEIPQGLRVIRSIDGLIKVDLNLIPPKTTAKIDQKVPTIRDSRSNSPLTVVSSPQRPIMINCAVQTHSNSPPLNASNSVPENASDTLLAPVSKSPSISSSLTASTQTEESALTSPQVPASPAGGGHTPSQEILTRYYSENVKLRDKVSGLQKDKRSLNDELFSCQQALEELKRERDALQARLKSQGGTSPYLSSEKQRSPLPEISYIQSSSPTDNNPTLDKQRTPGSSPFRVPIASLDSKSTCNRESFVPINADYTQEHYPKSFPESSGTSYYQRDSSGTRVRLSPDITASLDQRSLLPNTDYLSFRIRSPSTGRLSTSKEFVAPTVSNFQPFSSENPDPKTSPSQRRATSKN